MPGIDGIETLKRIRELDKTAKIVMVTGKKPEENDSARQAKEIGAVDYIHKALELDELEKVIMRLIKKIGK